MFHGCGSLSLKLPASNIIIFGCLSIGFHLVKLWYAKIADRCAFTVQY